MDIHLMLSYYWWDAMAHGCKDIEYRRICPQWQRLIWERRHLIERAIFHRAYTATSLIRPVELIDIGPCPYEGWEGDFYRLHLLPIGRRKAFMRHDL